MTAPSPRKVRRDFLFDDGATAYSTLVGHDFAVFELQTRDGNATFDLFFGVPESTEETLHVISRLRDAVENFEADVLAAINAAEKAAAAAKALEALQAETRPMTSGPTYYGPGVIYTGGPYQADPTITLPSASQGWGKIVGFSITEPVAPERPYSLLDDDTCSCSCCRDA